MTKINLSEMPNEYNICFELHVSLFILEANRRKISRLSGVESNIPIPSPIFRFSFPCSRLIEGWNVEYGFELYKHC